MQLTEVQIETAVEWWGKALDNPKFQTVRPDDASEGSRPAVLAQIMASMSHSSPDNGKIEKFKAALRKKLTGQPEEGYWLNVDYGPCAVLSECLEEADAGGGISSLPWKTSMRFRDEGVQVSCGYGEPSVELIVTDEEDDDGHQDTEEV